MHIDRHAQCFGCGQPGEDRLEPAFEWDSTDQVLRGTVGFGVRTQGPPGFAHGGSLATVLDEAMGAAAWMSGHPCVAVNLNVSFRNLVPLGSQLQLVARVDGVDGRKVTCSAHLRGEDGTVRAEATGLFVVIPEEKAGEVASLEDSQRMHRWVLHGRTDVVR